MYQQQYGTSSQQTSQQSTQIQEQDWGNMVLSELKRTAREYTTAALEATHPSIRQAFQTLSQKTMQEQAELFDVLSQLNGYGSIKMAHSQEIQQELQQQIQKTEQLQHLVQQAVQGGFAQAQTGLYQQQQHPANTAFQTNTSFQQQAQPSIGQGFGQQSQGYGQNPSSQGNQSFNQGYGNPSYTPSSGQTQNSSFSFGSGSQNLSGKSNSPQSYANSFNSISNSASKGAHQESYAPMTEPRGANSFDWHASDESESNSGSGASSDNSNGHNSKYLL